MLFCLAFRRPTSNDGKPIRTVTASTAYEKHHTGSSRRNTRSRDCAGVRFRVILYYVSVTSKSRPFHSLAFSQFLSVTRLYPSRCIVSTAPETLGKLSYDGIKVREFIVNIIKLH